MRKSGILLPVASLPGKYGIGAFSKEAYKFIDFLKASGQSYWQILPLGPTGYGDSPYQPFSTFAGNPYFIDLDTLIDEGLLTRAEVNKYNWGSDSSCVDYEKIWLSRFKVLKLAYERSGVAQKAAYKKFIKENAFWLDDYALYMSVKKTFDNVSFIEWDEDIRRRKPEAVKKYRKELKDEIDFYKFQQFKFNEQWYKLKTYANKNGIKIVGDIPIYVAFDSADTWANPELFQFDENGFPTGVAGCPPDGFSATGQLWGNPLYDYEYHKKTGYAWWIQRIRNCCKLYDVIRIDHFRGFDEYYNIPYGDKTAESGRWEKGPGIDLFNTLKKEIGSIDIIAEDLGFLTDTVIKLVKDTGYPGMKVLQFAFDSRESGDYLPHNYDKNSVVYTGTHDNNTILGWYEDLTKKDRDFATAYLNNKNTVKEELHWDYIRLAMSSVAKLCVIPMQDYLGLGAEARINTPATIGNNWKWRMSDRALTGTLSKKIYNITKIYARV